MGLEPIFSINQLQFSILSGWADTYQGNKKKSSIFYIELLLLEILLFTNFII